MDRQLVRQCDMEVMKMAMLKHEETFRQQVIKHQETLGYSSSSSSFILKTKRMYELLLIIAIVLGNHPIRSTSCTACTASRGS